MVKKILGKTTTHHKLIKRLFNGLKVEDAKKEMVIHAIESEATRDSVMVFDKAGKAEPGGYLLRPPSPGRTLDAGMESGRNRDKHDWNPGNKRRKKVPDVDFRNGTGLVQFLKAQKSWSRGSPGR